MALAILATVSFNAHAATINADNARMAANNFLKQNVASKSFKAAALADIKLAHAEASKVEGNAYYVFNINGGGWVIIAGDDRAKQVLAYGDKGNINMNSMPDNMTTGMSNTIADSSRATSCVCAMLEMSSPNESASRI